MLLPKLDISTALLLLLPSMYSVITRLAWAALETLANSTATLVANALIMDGENEREEDLREREIEELYEERGIPHSKGEE